MLLSRPLLSCPVIDCSSTRVSVGHLIDREAKSNPVCRVAPGARGGREMPSSRARLPRGPEPLRIRVCGH